MSYIPTLRKPISENTVISYEVVKEYNLVNESINDTFAYDGESFPDLTI